MPIAPTPSRGDIWLVDFDPAVGAEIRKLRPSLVVSLPAVGRLPLRLVVPITDWKAQPKQVEQGLWCGRIPGQVDLAAPVPSAIGRSKRGADGCSRDCHSALRWRAVKRTFVPDALADLHLVVQHPRPRQFLEADAHL